MAFAILLNSALAQHKTLTVYYSGDSSKVVNLSSTDSLVIFICGSSKVNYGGQAYNTVLIGNQCWLKENLSIGTMTPGTSSQANDGVIEKYCYNNSESNCATYGGLYQWEEAMQYVSNEGAKGICPSGWHIPTFSEFETLKAYVNSNGNALKKVGQGVSPGAGTNTSGFCALLSGDRHYSGGFYNLGYNSYIRSSTDISHNTTVTNILSLYHNLPNIGIGSDDKLNGISVRCLKN